MRKEQKLWCTQRKDGHTENFFTCLIAVSRRSLGGWNGNPPLYFCPEKNPMNRRAWWATVHGVSECTTWLSKWACNPSLNRTPQCQGYPLRILPHREKEVCGMQISSLLLWTSLSLCTDDPCSLRWHWTEVSEPRAPTPVSPPQGWCGCCAELSLVDPSHCCTLFYGVKRAGVSLSLGQKLLPPPPTTTSPGLDLPCPGLHCFCAPQGSPGFTAIHQSSLYCSFSWPEWSQWDPESLTLAPPWALRHPAMLHLLASPPKPVRPCWQPGSPWEVHGALSNSSLCARETKMATAILSIMEFQLQNALWVL